MIWGGTGGHAMKWNTLITPIQTHSDDDTLTETLVLLCFFPPLLLNCMRITSISSPSLWRKKKKREEKSWSGCKWLLESYCLDFNVKATSNSVAWSDQISANLVIFLERRDSKESRFVLYYSCNFHDLLQTSEENVPGRSENRLI